MFKKKVYLLITDCGSGHRSCADALKFELEKQGLLWDIKIVNFYREIVNEVDLTNNLFGWSGEDIYNNLLIRRKQYYLAQILLACFKWITKLFTKKATKIIVEYWKKNNPDIVISLLPFVNQALYNSLQEYNKVIPFIIFPTDIKDWTTDCWLGPKEAYYILNSKELNRQALDHGIPSNQIFSISGIPLHPKFYNLKKINKAKDRLKFGLNAYTPTAIIMFGTNAPNQILDMLTEIQARSSNIQVIIVCGHNNLLIEKINKSFPELKKIILGFTNNIPYYMQLADVFIGKPGACSVNEAVHMDLPIIIERTIWTMPQEISVAEWVLKFEFGDYFDNFKKINKSINKVIDNLHKYREKLSDNNYNKGVFEASEIITKILDDNLDSNYSTQNNEFEYLLSS